MRYSVITGAQDLLGGPGPIELVTIDRIASGSFGNVTKCEMSRGDSAWISVAVKCAREGSSLSSELLKRECCILRDLDHPNIVKLLAVARRDNSTDILAIQEHIRGPSLADVLQNQAAHPEAEHYSQKQALKWLVQIACAINYLHSFDHGSEYKYRVIHRDVSASNVMMTSTNLRRANAKLIDFGLAREMESRPCDVGSVTTDFKGSCNLGVEAECDMALEKQQYLPVAARKIFNETSETILLQQNNSQEHDINCDISASDASRAAMVMPSEQSFSSSQDLSSLDDFKSNRSYEIDCRSSGFFWDKRFGPLYLSEKIQTTARSRSCLDLQNTFSMASGSLSSVVSVCKSVDLSEKCSDGNNTIPGEDTRNPLTNGDARVLQDPFLKVAKPTDLSCLSEGCGTPLSMAPEVRQKSEKGYDTKADVYSFGMLVYQIFHYLPLAVSLQRGYGLTVDQAEKKLQSGWRPPISSWCPQSVCNVIEQCWHQDPVMRPDMSSVLEQLRGILVSLPKSRRKRISDTFNKLGDTLLRHNSSCPDLQQAR